MKENVENNNIEPNNEKNSKVLVLLVIIFGLLALGFGGYIVYDNFIVQTDIKDKQEEKEVEENELIEININDDMVGTAMNNFNSLYVNNEDLYAANGFKIDSINKTDLISTALANIEKKIEIESIYTANGNGTLVAIEELNNEIEELILNKQPLTIKDIEADQEDSGLPDYKYSFSGHIVFFGVNIKNDSLVVATAAAGNIGPQEYLINKNIVKAEKDNNYLYVYEKIAFAELAEYISDFYGDGKRIYDYYTNYLKTSNVTETITDEQTPKWHLYDTYKYTFKIDNGNYYFESLEVVK